MCKFCGVIAPVSSHGRLASQHRSCATALGQLSLPSNLTDRMPEHHPTGRRRFTSKRPPAGD
eukprot:4727589-Amphidinium_carterae.1